MLKRADGNTGQHRSGLTHNTNTTQSKRGKLQQVTGCPSPVPPKYSETDESLPHPERFHRTTWGETTCHSCEGLPSSPALLPTPAEGGACACPKQETDALPGRTIASSG